MQQVRPPLATPASHVGALVQVLSDPLSIQLSASMPEQAVEDGPNIGAPITRIGDQEGVPSSSLWPGSCGHLGK